MISEPSARRGSIEDIEEIRRIEDRAFGIHAYDYPMLRHMLEAENSITIVSVVEKRIIGYATVFFRKNSRVSHLESIAVDPDLQGCGIGRVLMGEVEKISLQMGCSKIVLETFERNAAAMGLYEQCGYSAKKIIPNYYTISFEGSRNAIRYEKSIATK